MAPNKNDISNILNDWDYDPTNVTARYVEDEEGTRKIQLRLDLGLFQMEDQGRPDGKKPRGYTSLLDYYKVLESTSKTPTLRLKGEQCTELQQEAVQYYYRYLARFALKDFDGVISDTRHNLELFEFVSRHAENEDLAWEFVQFKPYVCMMSAKAMAEKETSIDNYEAAMAAVEKALEQIKSFWDDQGEEDLMNSSYEVEVLNELMNSLRERRPKSDTDKLRAELNYAISTENYEQAASLRDRLQELEKSTPKMSKG